MLPEFSKTLASFERLGHGVATKEMYLVASVRFPGGNMKNEIEIAAKALKDSMDEQAKRGWPFGAYGDAIDLLKALEDRLSTRKRVPLKRFFVVPLLLWLRGLQQIAISYGRVYVFAFVLGFAGLVLARFLPDAYRPNAELLTLSINFFVAFSLVFAAPSTYCSAGTNEKHVSTVTEKLSEWKIQSKTRVDLILKNLKIFEERVKYRLMIFRWLLAAGWTLYYSPLLSDAIKVWQTSNASLSQFATLFPPFALLVFFFVLVEAYARGTDILFRCLDLGCNEHLATIDKLESNVVREVIA